MNAINPVEIPLSKQKISFMLVGAMAFVVLGIWFVISRPTSPAFNSPEMVFIAGLASILFFGFCAVVLIKKLGDNKPGLLIDAEGITDNSSGLSIGLIVWKDILEIQKSTVANQSFLLLILANPEDYIARQSNPIKRKMMEMNNKLYRSPVNISANALKYNFDDLYTLLKSDLLIANKTAD